MCGRFVITSPPAALRQIFGYLEQPNFPPRHNIAPTQPVPVVIVENGVRHFRLMRWGLLPAWVKDPGKFTLLINARSETVAEKPAFKNAIRRAKPGEEKKPPASKQAPSGTEREEPTQPGEVPSLPESDQLTPVPDTVSGRLFVGSEAAVVPVPSSNDQYQASPTGRTLNR